MDTFNSMQLDFLAKIYAKVYKSKKYVVPDYLTSWSRYYLPKYKGFIFQILEFSKNTKLQDLIENLSKKYWNHKGFYNLETKGNNMVTIFDIFKFIMFRF